MYYSLYTALFTPETPSTPLALEAAALVHDMTSLDLTVNETSFQGSFLILEGGREKDSVKKVAANDEL